MEPVFVQAGRVHQATAQLHTTLAKYDKKGDLTHLDYVMYTWKKGPDGKLSYFEN